MSRETLQLDLPKARQIVLSEMRSERRNTILALTISILIVGALLLDFILVALHKDFIDQRFVFGAIALINLFAIAGAYSFRFTIGSETARWFFLFSLAPFAIVFRRLIITPWLILHSGYAYQGRFKLADRLDGLADYATSRSRADTKNIIAAHRAQTYFKAGSYQKGLQVGQKASADAVAEYNKDKSDANLLCMIAAGGCYAGLAGMYGQDKEGELVLDTLTAKRDLIMGLSPETQAQAFSFLAYGCVHVGQFDNALEFSQLSAAAWDNSKIKPSPTAGCTSESWALAALGKGLLDQAEEQAILIHKHWGVTTTKTAERQADAYYVLAQVAIARGQTKLASEHYSLAIAIRELRNGKDYPTLLKYKSECGIT